MAKPWLLLTVALIGCRVVMVNLRRPCFLSSKPTHLQP